MPAEFAGLPRLGHVATDLTSYWRTAGLHWNWDRNLHIDWSGQTKVQNLLTISAAKKGKGDLGNCCRRRSLNTAT